MKQQPFAQVSLGWWNVYFLGKLFLFWKGLIDFQPLENLAFVAVLMVPLQSRLWQRVRQIVAVPVGIGLLYYDSWLPPVRRIFSQASQLAQFDVTYIVDLIGRFINFKVIALLILIVVIYWFLSQFLRVGVVVVGLIVAVLVTHHSQTNVNPLAGAVTAATDQKTESTEKPKSLDDVLKDFFASEAKRRVVFPKPDADAVPFDVIFIQICSLSWDDLEAVGLTAHPLWKQFDITLTHFNSADSYSEPAAISLLRAPCGQGPAKALFSPAPDGCYLMEDFRQVGFESDIAFNHYFEHFIKIVHDQRITQSPLPLDNLHVAQQAYDDSPVFDDFAVLSRWLDNRKKRDAARVALFYNTISLHDGNKLLGVPDTGRDSHDPYKYKIRLGRLLDNLDRFLTTLQASGRKTVVVVMAEHGAAFRGDKMQISGLREIPSPAITLVPLAIKVVGGDTRRVGEPAVIAESTSYLALSRIIANMLTVSPFNGGSFSANDYVHDIPTTSFVSQNEDMTVLRYNNQYYLQQVENGAWSVYDPGGL